MAIPLPGSAMQGFAQGFGGVNNVFKDLLQRKLQEQQLRQQMQNHEDMLKQQALDYALRQHADTRAGAASERNAGLYDLNRQLLQAKTGKAISDTAWNNMLLGGNPAPTGGQSSGGSQPNPQQFNALKDVVQNRNFAGGGAFPEQQQQPQGQIQPSAQQAAPEQMQEQENGVHVLQEGDPNKLFMNRFAGFKGIPNVQTHYDTNGNLITRYPNGRVEMQKVAPSQAEQKASELTQAQNIKDVHEYERDIPTSTKLLDKIDKALKIIPKHKEWFGSGLLGIDVLGGPKQRKRGITDPDYGVVEGLLGQLVGPQAKDLSGNRILATALGLAQDIKPGFGENYPIAYGKLKQIRDELAQSLGTQSELYQKAGGKNKYNIPKFEEGSGTTLLIDKNGVEYDVPTNKVDQFLEKHKDLKRG